MTLDSKNILITGSSGFIGYHLITKQIHSTNNCKIIGIDNMNDYYNVKLKKWRLNEINKIVNESSNEWIFIEKSIDDKKTLIDIFKQYSPDYVVNLAAQAGVRYSIENPDIYIQSNILGFYNILEACRNFDVKHLVFASSSSVYGGNTKIPFSTEDKTDSPVSLYAATKKSNEAMAHAYSKLYNIPTTGLRFFTVYGPAGRPDMAYFSFTNKLIKGEKIKVFNYGNCKRDFTYIDDITDAMFKIIQKPPEKNIGADGLPIPPYKIYNIGNNHPENLLDFINILSEELISEGILPTNFNLEEYIELTPMQPGDVSETFADITELEKDFNFKPTTDFRTGIKHFTKWYKDYYNFQNTN